MGGTVDHGPGSRAARWINRLADLLLAIGLLAAVIGVAYPINGMTQAGATVKVAVALATPEMSGWGNTQVAVAGVEIPDGWLAAAAPSDVIGTGPTTDGTLTLAAWGSTRTEQLLNRGGILLGGLGLLIGSMALRPVLRSIAAGQPFERGNTRRIVLLAVTVAVTGTLMPLPPSIAGDLVLERIGLADNPVLTSTPWLGFSALLTGALLLALAAAFRAGEGLARDMDGLV